MPEVSLRADGPSAPVYRAFISYSHQDKAAAARLHRGLEFYAVPSKLVGTTTSVGVVPRRLTPIFRDRDELAASADLGGQLQAALESSLFLVVICSPASARSHWVEQEILRFKQMHGESRVLALIVDGTPYASGVAGREDEECFPKPLRYQIGPDGELSDIPAEPIAADLRKEADGWRLARLKLIAGLTGLRLDDVVQREAQRRVRRLAFVAAVGMTGMVAMGGLALYANASRIEANRQRVIAQKEAAAARAASDYLVGTFELSNPATENPRTITALTILGRSAERARRELAGQPEIQARLLATLGRAYNNLGLLRESETAFEASLPAIQKAGPDGAEAMLILAQTYASQGDLDRARETIRKAETMLGPDLKQHTDVRGVAAQTEGRILTAAADVPGGVAAFDRALAFYRQTPNIAPTTIARVLNNRGLLLSDAGRFDDADQSLSEALRLYREAYGDKHLLVGKSWFAIAQNAFNAGHLPQAETAIGNALAVERTILESDNPTLADTLSMQGQIYQGEGKLPQAERSLREAIAIYRKAFDGPHYLIGIAEVYLALIQSDRGDTDGALRTLDDAKRNYDASYGKIHANHGDLLVNRAKVLAKAGRKAEARTDCAAGLKILGETMGPDAPFTKSMTAECAKI